MNYNRPRLVNLTHYRGHGLLEIQSRGHGSEKIETGPLLSCLAHTLSVREVWHSNPGSVKSETESPTAHHRCDVPSELCSPGAKPRR